MPNIQIRGSQIQGESVEASNINLSGSFDFRAATGMQFLTKPEADKTTFPATTQYVHTIVSGSLIDGFQGGDGISIDTATSPDTIAVDLAANKGLEFAGGELQIKLDGSTLALASTGIKISDGGVDGAQLANLAVATAKIADAAVSTAKIANLAVTAGKIGNGEVGYAQINFESNSDNYSPNGSTLSFALTAEVDDAMIAMVLAFKNGLLQKQVQSSPSGADEYTVSTTDGTTTLTFGANLSASDTLEVRYLANKSA